MNATRQMPEELFEEKYDCYHEMVFKIAYAYCKNITDSEDIVQNVFLKYFTKNVKFNSLEHEKYWLIRITINECKNQMKSHWRQKVVLADDVVLESAKDVPSEERTDTVLQAVARLDAIYKEVIILYYFQDMAVKEIAQVLEVSESNVKKRLERARKILKITAKEEKTC